MSEDRGYSVTPGVFEPREMTETLAALQQLAHARSKAGARHILKVPVVACVANDPRLMDLARQFVGPAPMPFRATLFDKSAASNWLVVWHQDTALPLRARVDDPAWGPWSTKAGTLYAHAPSRALEQVIALRVHLDDSTESNGPLRVLPGSHQRGVLTDQEIQDIAATSPGVDCVAPAGSVVAMRPLIVHASSKASDGRPRRVLHVEYSARVDLGDGVELAVG